MRSGQPSPVATHAVDALTDREHRDGSLGVQNHVLGHKSSKTKTGKSIQDIRSWEDQEKFRKHGARQVRVKGSC